MEPEKTKRPTEPGKAPFTVGIVLLVIGALVAVMNLSSTETAYVGGRMVETQGTLSIGAIALLLAGVILAGLGYLKKR